MTTVSATAPAPGCRLDAHQLVKRYDGRDVLQQVSLSAAPGEIVAVTGPSGAGKTTLGRLLSGLARADAGRVTLGERELLDIPPQRRHVAHMFESFALYPHLSAYDNVASPLRSPACRERPGAAEIERRVREVMALTEIEHLRERRPSDLSGGQKQRVALCRTLVQQPDLFILDEPIGHLDAKLRHKLRGELRQRQRRLAQPTLWLTPDAVEAMAVADRVVVLVGGRVRQVGQADALTLRPADVDVARLIGDPSMNLLALSVPVQGAPGLVHAAAQTLALPAPAARRLARGDCAGQLVLGCLPLATRVRPGAPGPVRAPGELGATVYSVEPFGKFTLVTVEAGGARLRSKMPAGFRVGLGEPVTVCLPDEGLVLFDSGSGRQLT